MLLSHAYSVFHLLAAIFASRPATTKYMLNLFFYYMPISFGIVCCKQANRGWQIVGKSAGVASENASRRQRMVFATSFR